MQSTTTRRFVFGTLLAVLWVVVGALAPVSAAPGPYHEDERVGFKIKTPKDWDHVAMRAEEQWIVGKFISAKTHTYLDEVDKSTWTHRPHMTIITFIDEVVKKDGAEISGDEESGFLIEINNPFKNYRDYLKRTYSGGGWFVSAEEEGEVKGVKVTMLEIKVEKLSYDGPKRIVTWIFHLDDVDLAVQFEVLEGSYPKMKSDIRACLKSFRKIPRTKGSLTPTTTGEKTKPVDEEKLEPAARVKHRREQEESLRRKTIASLPDDWKVKEMGPFLVLIHGDEKYAKDVVAQAKGVWNWLDKTFPYIGPDEYVRGPIIRICKDSAEEGAFFSGTAWGNSLEIVTHKDKGSGSLSWEFEYVNRRMLSIWFNHHDRDLYSALPHWLDNGLWQVVNTARVKGSKVTFKVDDWEREGLRESVRNDNLTPPRELMTLGRSEFGDNPHRTKQSAAFVRFLLESKSKKVRVVLESYIKNLMAVVAETKEATEKESPSEYKPPETEEEEEEMFKKRREAFKEKEAEFLEEVFERTFGDWSDNDWKRLRTNYYKSFS